VERLRVELAARRVPPHAARGRAARDGQHGVPRRGERGEERGAEEAGRPGDGDAQGRRQWRAASTRTPAGTGTPAAAGGSLPGGGGSVTPAFAARDTSTSGSSRLRSSASTCGFCT